MDDTEITKLLHAAGTGRDEAMKRLVPVVYEELHGLARRLMANERAGHTLSPTALVHEAFLKLLGGEDVPWENRRHFFAAAAAAMRRILVDRARHYATERRGAGRARIDLESDLLAVNGRKAEAILALDSALTSLETLDARKSEVVMLRYFAGLSVEDTAAALGVAPRTVKREWQFARAWLYSEMDVTGEREP